MDKRNNSGGNGFNVFIFGIFVGVLATLLLTTKKGRKILKIILNEGAERISQWEDVVASLKTQVEEDDMADEPIMGEEVKPAVPDEPKKLEKIEIDTFTEADVEDQSLSSEMPAENEIKSKADLKKTIEIKTEESIEPAPKKKSRFFKGTRKKSS